MGDRGTLFDAETPNAPQASQRFALSPSPGTDQPYSFSVELTFAADPGAFSFQIQTADTDADVYYVTIPTTGTISSVSATYFRARAEFTAQKARFVRGLISSRTNAVACTATITR